MPPVGNAQDGSNQANPNDSSNITELLQELILEVRSMRIAIIHMATQDGETTPGDFDPQNLVNIDEEQHE